MKNQFKVGQIVKIINVNLLDCYNPDTNEKDVFWGDEFEVLEIIDFEDDDCDLLLNSIRFNTKSIINSSRFEIVK
jgi:hypothetical protein